MGRWKIFANNQQFLFAFKIVNNSATDINQWEKRKISGDFNKEIWANNCDAIYTCIKLFPNVYT